MLRPRRIIVLAFLGLLVTALPSPASPLRKAPGEHRLGALLDWTARALDRLWFLFPQSPRLKEGLGIDPHGACSTSPSPACGQQATGEEGLGIDPNGGN